MSDQTDIRRGELAKQVIDNEVYAEAYQLIEQGVINRWRDSRDAKEREQLHLMLLMLGRVREQLQSVMNSGEIAHKKLLQERSRVQRIGDYFKAA